MKIKKITVSKGVTLPTDEKFRMARYDFLLEAELDEGEKVAEVSKKLKKGLDTLIRRAVEEDGLEEHLGNLA